MAGMSPGRIAALCAWGLLLGLKLVLAQRIDLYADEAFYFQCSLRPALAYADLPPLTALWVRAGTWLWGAHPFGVRFFFVLAGMVTPWLVYLLARRFGPPRHAVYAACATCLIPGFGFLGLFAIPDVLLALLSILFLLLFDTAFEKPRVPIWLGLGITAGLGLLTHYRFSLIILATMLFLLFTQSGRAMLKRPGIWLTGLVALGGLAPALIYNWQHQAAPLRYFLGTRHQTHLEFGELAVFVAEQLAVITPLMAILLGLAFLYIFRAARSRDPRASFFLIFALLPLVIYGLASPLHATGAQRFHWPLAAYLPMLAWLPLVQTKLQSSAATWRKWRILWVTGPLLAGLILGVLFLDLASGKIGLSGFRDPFYGWSQLAQTVEDQLEVLRAQNVNVSAVVADNYKLGAQLELYLGSPRHVYILDHSKNYEHGRQLQFQYWNRGEEALRSHQGQVVLVAVLWSELATPRDVWERHLAWHFQPLQELQTRVVEEPNGTVRPKEMTLYLGEVIPKR